MVSIAFYLSKTSWSTSSEPLPVDRQVTLAEQVVGHGCQGRDEVIKLKMEYFKPCAEKNLPTYYYLDFFCVDLEDSCVRFGFRCLIPDSEGKGTQFLHFDEV